MLGPRFKLSAIPIIIVIIIVSIIVIDLKIKASLLEIAKSKAQVSGVEAINEIVNAEIVSQVKYSDIVCVHKDSAGRIVLIQPNTIMLNKIMANTVGEVAHSVGKMSDDTIGIPVGQLLGSQMIAGYGPKLKVKIIPTGKVYVNVMNKFEQAGINQTRHLIYLNIENRIKVAVPFLDDEVVVATTVPLAETIIVGDVPQTYVNFKGNDELPYPFIKNN